MKLLNEYPALVILGNWNNAIFSPEWVAKYLLLDESMQVDIPINVNGSLRFSNSDLRFFIVENKLHITVINIDDAIYTRIGKIALSLANYLPHTPVSNFGLNFNFEATTEEIEVPYTMTDIVKIESFGFSTDSQLLTRSFKKDDYTLNFTISKKDEKILFNFNYHFDITTLLNFKEKFESDSLLTYKAYALSLLADIYSLKLS